MLATKNEAIDRAVSGAWQLTEEEMIREKCRARDEWVINDKWKTDTIAQLRNETNSERNRADKAEARIRELEAKLAALKG